MTTQIVSLIWRTLYRSLDHKGLGSCCISLVTLVVSHRATDHTVRVQRLHSCLPLVPCYRRCYQISEVRSNEKCIHLSEDDEEGWVDTHHGMSELGGPGVSCDCHMTHSAL